MNPQSASYSPTAAHLRYTLERLVLGYYQNDNVTLKPIHQWPGFYTLKNGQRIPCVFAEGEDLVPSSWKATGVQCIISDCPEDERRGGIGQAHSVSSWQVTFTNFGQEEGTERVLTNILTLREVQSRMGRLFSTANFRYMRRSEVALEALTVRFRSTQIAPLLRP